ncbi:unnamed protein product [Clonostachys solani]|uniref:Uncharacterized protein n=1 Tax=Clonostachys solani TaxID=160281 RepID=A0A9N9Z7H7_9HYPO|nr:unnamed protein product [Clonostachys solani]
MPRRGRSSAKNLQREPSIVVGELDTTPTSHHAETLSDFADHQEFFEDVIADEDLLALDKLLAPNAAHQREKSFTWSEAGSTRRSSPIRGEVSNNAWEFDVEDSLPAMSSPKSGIDKLPATFPLPPQDHIEPTDLQPIEMPARKVDFSETASTARRSTPFGLDEVSSLGPWEFETPSVKQTSLAAHDKQEAGSSRPPEREIEGKYAAAVLSEVRTNNKGMTRSSKQEIINSLSKSTDIDGVVLKASPTLLSKPAPIDTAKLQNDSLNNIRLDLESEEDMIFPSSPQISKMEVHSSPFAEPATTGVRKTRKRKQRAKSPVKFDEDTQQVKVSRRSTAQKVKRKRAAPPRSTKGPATKKPKIAPQPKASILISQTPVTNKGHEFARATKKENKVLAVEKPASSGRLPEPSPTISKINVDPIVLSSDPESSEFIPSSPSYPLSSFEKQHHPQKGEKRPQSGLQISKSRSESLEPPQAPELKPLSEEDTLPDTSNASIDSLTHPIPTTLRPIEKVEEAGNDNRPTLPEPEETKCNSSRNDFQNGDIPKTTANEPQAESPEPLPSRNKTPQNNPIAENSKGTSAHLKDHTTAVSLPDERAREKRDKRQPKSSRPKLVLKSSFKKIAHSISPAEERLQHPNSRSRIDNLHSGINNTRSRIDLNMNQSRTLSISEAGSPVRLDSHIGGSGEDRYPLPKELEFKNLDTTSRFPQLQSEIGKIQTVKTENRPRRTRDITNSVSAVGNCPNPMDASNDHAAGADTQHFPVYPGASSGESNSPRLQKIRGKIKAQMEADFEEQTANRNRPVAQGHNTDTSRSELPVAQTNTCSPLATGSIPKQLHRIVEVEHVPSTYMNGMSGALRRIERRFNRERRELEQDWARDVGLFKANVAISKDKVSTIQEERNVLLASIKEEEAKRRLLYSRASSNLLALNRTLLNSAVATENKESSGTR